MVAGRGRVVVPATSITLGSATVLIPFCTVSCLPIVSSLGFKTSVSVANDILGIEIVLIIVESLVASCDWGSGCSRCCVPIVVPGMGRWRLGSGGSCYLLLFSDVLSDAFI